MPTREEVPAGAPCWVELSAGDVEAARRFYAEVLGWEAQEPNPDFGGYFMFTRNGSPVAGCTAAAEGQSPGWGSYMATSDAHAVASTAALCGGRVVAGPAEVADLGTMVIVTDVAGATVGAWEAGSFAGFAEVGEPGTPSWFELHTDQFADAQIFYRAVFGWDIGTVSDTDEFRYATVRHPEGGSELAGLDEDRSLGELTSYWLTYWAVEDVDAAVGRVSEHGGTVDVPPADTPYGRIAVVADPDGAVFALRTPPAGEAQG